MPESPSISVEPMGVAESVGLGLWGISWRIQNLGASDLGISETWLPHGRFRAGRQSMEPPLRVEPGQEVTLTFEVACQEEPRTIVENAFLILIADWQGEPWRLLARLAIDWSEAAEPQPRTELITSQRVGFAAAEPT
ncbi:MAG TPA: hypothetical protein VGK54_10450 [Chloroflexota bacterium]